jgi:uncharacterized protein YgfB (UPF0149 family)
MRTPEKARETDPWLSSMSEEELEEALRRLQDLAQLAVDDLLAQRNREESQPSG